MGDIQIARIVQSHTVRLIIDLLSLLGRQVREHLHGPDLAFSKHFVSEDAIALALRHQKGLAVGPENDAIGIGQPFSQQVSLSFSIGVMHGTVGILGVGFSGIGEIEAPLRIVRDIVGPA
jgi:hypothetical protein